MVKNENQQTKKKNNDLSFALMAFGGLGLEVLWIIIEPWLYRLPIDKWGELQQIMHWLLTVVTWGSVIFMLLRASKRKEDRDILAIRPQLSGNGCIMAVLLLFAAVIIMNIGWEQFKIFAECQGRSWICFAFQYLYYLFEMGLVTLIIVFGQSFGERISHCSSLSWGGLMLAVTWGLAHFFTQGVQTGIITIILSFIFGTIYLCVKKHTCLTYVVLTVIFLL